ncbi:MULTISPECIES: type I-E CRISPR-associated protein Cse1/CasA [Streptomyces]|uniref:Type I-E CRISPR-associated protein Cse1/CasA n=1 Tax=Streptomyces doudnae TaxID=3075536 RepID=A0ABD5EFA8_9ACTN|nr:MULTISPECIES: type I-E CRISPR-associated protein Cse1/CasA [unclassified Streptomyces]MDT0433316.1 type I-E CRISPR-associated protein Cse1/CasA [Streptomyces sp. DSM 41981]SCE42908.1 CRISPR system Cascade subunit CasA [Streptomyces sp. SolWspMP-5a-2]
MWAKHDRTSDGWLPLWRHMADSGAVAGKLWDSWLPESVKRLLSEALPGGEGDGRLLVGFLSAVHDIGKCSPAFACQVEQLADRMRDRGLTMPTVKEYGQDRRLAPHGLAGQLLLQEWLRERFGLGARLAGQFAVVAGGHHGVPPSHQQMHDLQLRPHLLRHTGPSELVWRRTQFELMDWSAELAGVEQRLQEWSEVRLPQTVQVLATAVVILADWIASAPELFPYAPESWQPPGPAGERRRLEAAWKGLDLPAAWRPVVPSGPPQGLFSERFPHLAGRSLRPVQEEAVRMAQTMEPAGLLIIEAPMGEGKTEAALAAAEVLAARSGAGGVLVALPTRATGDAMFARLLAWLNVLPDDGSGRRSLVLAHAKAALNASWSGLLKAGTRTLAGVDMDDENASEIGVEKPGTVRHRATGLLAHQWLRGRKKQLLASFGVGTVDQVLFAALKSRHLALRHLAVAGKVVVIDEVHAYDAYMNRYLDRTLHWLAAYKVPVVLLSATLPAERRNALAAAYAGGSTPEGVESQAGVYPLLTAVAPGLEPLCARPEAAADRGTAVVVERVDDDLGVLADRLEAELADGGCALVVRNTVARVLEAAEVLRERLGDTTVSVAHSRFLAADRASNDVALLEQFGPAGERPDRHVVIASQVVENSLDVSFDLLVSDLAPVDLMLQRMGRLHRHPGVSRPARLSTARCLVTGVDWSASPPLPVPGSRAVYPGEWTLLRSLAVLDRHLDGRPVVLPADISDLVHGAYADQPIGPTSWSDALDQAHVQHRALLDEKLRRADGFLLGPVQRPGRPVYGWLEAHAGDADDSREGRAQVRDGEETLEVLVVQRGTDGRLRTVPWLDEGRGGLELPTEFPPGRRAAEAVAASSLTLPGRFSKRWMIDRVIRELEQFMVPAWQVKECPWLAGELLLVLDSRCQTRLAGFDLRYHPAVGLEFTHASSPEEGTRNDGAGKLTRAQKQTKPKAAGEFNLVTEPWVPVQRVDGTMAELSLLEVFAQADSLRRTVGDIPTQDLALLRLMLAIVHDALDGPADLEEWEAVWKSREPFAPVADYLADVADHFDLLHPERPFFQTPDLRTSKGEIASLSRIVADVPSGSPLFAMRRPGVGRLPFAEAARWLLHAHAFDTSGIKSAMQGDEKRSRAGKVYPLGVGSLGNLGGVFAEGATLRETLLLNLIAFEDAYQGSGHADQTRRDRPVWKQREPYGPGVRGDEAGGPEPMGLRDLYTWQSRRIRLCVEDDAVTGVVLGYGDQLSMAAPWRLEPMTGWRRSPTQEKKQGRSRVYGPVRHDPARTAWRGLAALLPARSQSSETAVGGEPARDLRSGITRWYTQIITDSEIDPGELVRLRLVGIVYGTQQSVIEEIVDDSVVLPVVTLHATNPVYGAAALDAVADAENAVTALGQLAANLARASGSDHHEAAASAARDLAYGTLDGPCRAWLRSLARQPDLQAARQQWRGTVRLHLLRLCRELLRSASPAAVDGRVVDLPGLGPCLVDAGRAELWFHTRLRTVLGPSPRP